MRDDKPNGIGVDKSGGPVIDPTKNVMDMVDAAISRQDDLREETNRRMDAEISNIKQMMIDLKEHAKELGSAEAKRIDAIRAVDVNAVAVASERQSAAATVLANQVSQSADALRTLVSTTATATAEQSRQQMAQVTDRLTAVERVQYEGRGRQVVDDPRMAQLVEQVDKIASAQQTAGGKSQGLSMAWAFTIGAAGLILALMTIGSLMFAFTRM